MLDKIVRIFQAGGDDAQTDPQAREATLRLATAALLVEMARADFAQDESERKAAQRLLEEHFSLDADQASDLLGLADTRAKNAVSLHEFTSVLHEHLPLADKQQIVKMLWQVALADSELDMHEEHLVRKVAGLLYLPGPDLMRLKHEVLGALTDD